MIQFVFESDIYNSYDLISKEIDSYNSLFESYSLLDSFNIVTEAEAGKVRTFIFGKLKSILQNFITFIRTKVIPKIKAVWSYLSGKVTTAVLKLFDKVTDKLSDVEPFDINSISDDDWDDDLEDDEDDKSKTESAQPVNEALLAMATTIAVKKIVKKYCIPKLFPNWSKLITSDVNLSIPEKIKVVKDIIALLETMIGGVVAIMKTNDNDYEEQKRLENKLIGELKNYTLMGVRPFETIINGMDDLDNIKYDDPDKDKKEKDVLNGTMAKYFDMMFNQIGKIKIAGTEMTWETIGGKFLFDHIEKFEDMSREEATKYGTHVVMVHFYRMVKDKIDINKKTMAVLENMFTDMINLSMDVSEKIVSKLEKMDPSKAVDVIAKMGGKVINLLNLSIKEMNTTRVKSSEQSKLCLKCLMETERELFKDEFDKEVGDLFKGQVSRDELQAATA